MKSKLSILILLISGLGLSLWIAYKPKLITPDSIDQTQDTFLNSPGSAGAEAGIQNTVELNTPDRSMNAKRADEQVYLDDAKLIQIAYERAKQGADIPEGLAPQITYKGDNAEIVWPIQSQLDNIFPRGDYHALVVINRKSGEVIRLLSSP